MYLRCLESSSSGNCYLLTSRSGETLVIESGVRFSKVKEALDFDISGVKGLIISHEHKDHSKYVKDYLTAGIDVFASLGTIKAIKFNHHRFSRARHNHVFMVGEFTIMPFDIQHDCAEGLGYLIKHIEMGTCLFLTDSFYVEYKFPGLNNIMIEANNSEQIISDRLESGTIHPSVANRVNTSHMSIETLKTMLNTNDLTQVNNIVLLHLSDGNSDAKAFKKDIEDLTMRTVHIADKGLCINFDKTPF